MGEGRRPTEAARPRQLSRGDQCVVEGFDAVVVTIADEDDAC